MGYISTAEANTYLGVSGQDTLVDICIEMATSTINAICGVSSFVSATISDERHDYNGLGPYYFKNIPILTITEVNGSAVSYTLDTHFIVRGCRVEFAPTVSFDGDTTWDKVTFTYTAGYTTIPPAIKQACYILISSLRNSRNSEGVSSRTQGDLSIAFGSEAGKSSLQKAKFLLGKYILPKVYS